MAGSLMTTEYVFVHESASVEGAIEALRNFEGALETIHDVFLVDKQGILTGTVPLARIVLAAASTPLPELAGEPLIYVQADDGVRSVVDLFHKYNLMSLPVVDEDRRLVGTVTADDVLERVINRK